MHPAIRLGVLMIVKRRYGLPCQHVIEGYRPSLTKEEIQAREFAANVIWIAMILSW